MKRLSPSSNGLVFVMSAILGVPTCGNNNALTKQGVGEDMVISAAAVAAATSATSERPCAPYRKWARR